MSAGAVVIEGWAGEEPLQAHSCDLWWASCLHGLLLAWLVSPLGSSQYGFIERTSEKVRKGRQDGSQSLSVISGMTVHYFCLILFVRRKSLNPIYAQGEGLHKGASSRRMFGGDLRGCQLHPSAFSSNNLAD